MADNWKSELVKFISGESTVHDGTTWRYQNRSIGGYGDFNHNKLVQVQVKVPTDYSKMSAATKAATLIYKNVLPSHPKVKYISFWDYSLMYGCDSDDTAQAFASELKSIKATNDTTTDIDYKMLIVTALAVIAVIIVLVKPKKH